MVRMFCQLRCTWGELTLMRASRNLSPASTVAAGRLQLLWKLTKRAGLGRVWTRALGASGGGIKICILDLIGFWIIIGPDLMMDYRNAVELILGRWVALGR